SPASIDAAAERQFSLRDANGDGFLNQEEMPAGLKAVWKKYDQNGDGLISLTEFKAYYRDSVLGQSTPANPGGASRLLTSTRESDAVAEGVWRAAGLDPDGAALLEYFRERTRPRADLKDMLAEVRQLGQPEVEKRSRAVAKILARGHWAIPALHHVING